MRNLIPLLVDGDEGTNMMKLNLGVWKNSKISKELLMEWGFRENGVKMVKI